MAKKVQIDTPAPDFSLDGFRSRPVCLSDHQGERHVILIFKRGFACPFCRGHMAQLRPDYEKFVERDGEVVVVGPEDPEAFQRYWDQTSLPFAGLPDPQHNVLKLYGQEVNLFKLGRMPAQVVVDKGGTARYVHYGHAMSDMPPNEELLALLDELRRQTESHPASPWRQTDA